MSFFCHCILIVLHAFFALLLNLYLAVDTDTFHANTTTWNLYALQIIKLEGVKFLDCSVILKH